MLYLNSIRTAITVLTVLVILTGIGAAQKRSVGRVRGASSGADENWSTYGGTLHNQRYSSLARVTRGNVNQLALAWSFQPSRTTQQSVFECTPIVVDGVMFVTTGDGFVYALDAATGDMIWETDLRVDHRNAKLCCGVINRGVAVSAGRVYVATIDCRLMALDAKTGKPVESFGEKGSVKIADHRKGYSETAAPVAADGKVFIGVAGGEFEIRGFFNAYDAVTGRLIWRWHTIPAPEEPGGETWITPGSYKVGGGPAWMNPAIDQENRLVIFGTGNPNPDLNGATRAGDNLYTCSVVALDMDTGRLRWYFQEVKHDLWDYDQAAPPVLFESVMNGKRFQAVGAAGKVGWFYILNRKTGESLLPLREMAVPQDPEQATAKTQTVPDVPPFVPIRNLFAPPTKKGVVVEPGSHGGSKWSPLAYSPRTGLIYIGAVHKPTLLKLGENKPDTFGQILGGTIDLAKVADPSSEFLAIDVNTGLVKWRTPVKPYPGGGHLVTAGDLMFAGDTMGSFIAMNAETGQPLWQFRCIEKPHPYSIPYIPALNSAPMTYEAAGRQFIAVAGGGRAVDGGAGKLFVFSLPVK